MSFSRSQLADIRATDEIIYVRVEDSLGENDDSNLLKRLIMGQKLLNISSSEQSRCLLSVGENDVNCPVVDSAERCLNPGYRNPTMDMQNNAGNGTDALPFMAEGLLQSAGPRHSMPGIP